MTVVSNSIVRVIAVPKPLKSPHILGAVGSSAHTLVIEMHSVTRSEPMKPLSLERRTPPRLLGYVEGQAVFMVAVPRGGSEGYATSLVRGPTPNQVLLGNCSEGAMNGHCPVPVRIQHFDQMVSCLNFEIRENV